MPPIRTPSSRGPEPARYSIESVNLPVNPPVLPMLSKRIDELPAGDTWIFEPKWDGFRALVFRDRDEILIQSRDGKSLNRYFPELLGPLQAQLPARCVLDGEIVIAKNGGLDFEALQLRIHPAASRVKLLSQETPASIVFFDLLCEGDRDLRGEPFQSRRHSLETLLSILRHRAGPRLGREARRVRARRLGDGAGSAPVAADAGPVQPLCHGAPVSVRLAQAQGQLRETAIRDRYGKSAAGKKFTLLRYGGCGSRKAPRGGRTVWQS